MVWPGASVAGEARTLPQQPAPMRRRVFCSLVDI
jgi:hypothetical protein